MPRRNVENDPAFIELRDELEKLESEKLAKILPAKKHIAETEAKIEYLKSRAIVDRIKWGMSAYAAAKAAGVKSSQKRASIISDNIAIVEKWEAENGKV